ncbi:MAG: prolipoprotein diacylglyceryl transferase [Lachnospiraceae bacterium]|nr:prolipoprotein diacylglyceryl transferase [Lachnospiraceae bacterium]
MGKWDIAFPNLGIYLENLPKNFELFGLTIAFYGLIIAVGVFLGFSLTNHESNRLGYPKDIWWDFAIPAIICCILGARIYYVVFSWDYYKEHLDQIMNIRGGGLAIYGAVIAGFFTLLVFCKIRKQNLWRMADVAVLGLLVGQIIGRWGNFMNREAFGGYTDGLFAMQLPIEAVRKSDISADIAAHITDGVNYIQVHPTFLYESVLNLILLLVLWLYRKHKKFDGDMMLIYLGGYGIIRFFVEGLRTDQLQIGSTGIAVSQMLGLILFVFSLGTQVIVRVAMKNGLKQREPLEEKE